MEQVPHGLDRIAELWDFSDPKASGERFRSLAARAEVGGELSYAAEARTQLARCLGLLSQFDEGHEILDEIAAGGGPLGPRASVRMLLERGRLMNSGGDPVESRAQFLAAWDGARHADEDDLAVDAAHMLGIVEETDAAREWNEKGLELAAGSSDPAAREWKATLLNNQGWLLHDAGDFREALHRFEEALAARRAAGRAQTISHAQWAVARCLRSLGRLDDSLTMQLDLLVDLPDDGFVHEEIAECLLALGRPLEARPHFADAHRLLSSDAGLAASQPERIARLGQLALTS